MNTYPNKLLVIANTKKRYQKQIKEGINKLEANGFKCLLLDEDYKALYHKQQKERTNIKNIDYICSIGGDGALLYAGKYAIKYSKPLFGINYGHVGFLCAYEKEEMDIINPISLSKKKVKKENLLKCVYKGKAYYSINDVIIGKDNFGLTINLKVNLNKKELSSFRGDGLIVSTKLGSNAYSKSSGSPVLKNSNKFIVSAICPSNSAFKYKVIDDDSIVDISLINKQNSASIFVDGKLIGPLTKPLTVSKASKNLEIIL